MIPARAQHHIWRSYQVALPIQHKLRGTLRLAVLSDLHVGSHSDDIARLTRIVDEVGQRQFDILLLPGDFINMQIFGGGRVTPDRIAEVLAPLARRMPTFAVLGNHDAEYGLMYVEESLTSAGINVLHNKWSSCTTMAGDVCIVGLEDELNWSARFCGSIAWYAKRCSTSCARPRSSQYDAIAG